MCKEDLAIRQECRWGRRGPFRTVRNVPGQAGVVVGLEGAGRLGRLMVGKEGDV